MNTNYNINFENPDLWKNYDPKNVIKNKIKLVLDFIPEDVNSIIDVGCGNGIITNELAQKYSVVGVDKSKDALNHIKCKSILSSSDKISVSDSEIDMVFSSELLEHLPKEILLKTIKEFNRIAKKYIFITVPNNELLEVNYIKCPKCNHVFHSYSHLNSFKESDIIRLFEHENIKHLKTVYVGPKKQKHNPYLIKIKQKIGNRWFNPDAPTTCPNCLNNEFPTPKGNVISKICNGLNSIFLGKKPYWTFVLFQKISS